MMEDSSPPLPPNKKKRLLDDAFEGTNRSSSNSQWLLLQQQKLDTLQAELTHERSMRSFDQQRHQQQQERLQQQAQLALDEAASAKRLLDQWRDSHHSVTESLRQSRDGLQTQVQDLRIQLEEAQAAADEHVVEREQWRRSEQECRRLEARCATAVANETAWRNELEELQQQIVKQKQSETAPDDDERVRSIMDEAPPAVLKELTRVRIKLAETERRERQLGTVVRQSEQRIKTLIQEREQALQQGRRLPAVEAALQKLQQQHERVQAENDTFCDFSKRLALQLRSLNVAVPTQHDDGHHPPEISTMLRFVETAQKQATRSEHENKEVAKRCNDLQENVQTLETQLKELEEKERAWAVERQEMEQKDALTQLQVKTLQEQHAIYQREADSLRALIKTFDELPLAPRGSTASSPRDTVATTKALEISLSSTRQELELIRSDRDRLAKDLEASNKDHHERRKELERTRDKFFKLRDALQKERVYKETAEARANKAEARAGKGSFDPESTRILHLRETPLTTALKEEIKVLKRQIELYKGGERQGSKLNAPDPDKLNQRLKQNFKEQIAVFREGVYLMTGYKVDMLPGTDRPTFRVRSMYAEKEEDHLMFKWPKKSEQVTSLDVLSTDLAKLLATTPSYEYMAKFHSLPAFLASVQLSLFEKATVMM